MIEIRPHTGYRRGNLVDTGIDAVWLVDPLHPKGIRLGFAARNPGAPLQLTENGIAATVISQAKRALAERDGCQAEREVQEPPRPIEGSEEDDD
jgi:hypothetical protein